MNDSPPSGTHEAAGRPMKPMLLALAVVVIGVLAIVASLHKNEIEPGATTALKERYSRKEHPSVDHSRFVQLQQPFTSPRQVTAACIACHNGRHKEVMASSHWNWEREEYVEGKGIRSIGKKNIVNNFCIGTTGSHQSCNKCHIGYGWGDSEAFDFNDSTRVDCLACHDNSDTYVKGSGMAGLPDTSVNLNLVAQHVGRPSRSTCGTCHFFGGGGNNVKHGDLEKALFSAPRTVDVHMGADGVNMQCVDCHTAVRHQMKGKAYSVSSMNRNRVQCEDCHTALPHDDNVLNEHTYKVSCQACHIPTYAKVNKTKVRWDWSTAGRLDHGEPIEEKDSAGYDTYLSIKGSFTWAGNLTPEYVWFNGTASHYLLGDSIDEIPLRLNRLEGDYRDPDAKIIPVKIHRSRQPYDPLYHWIIQPRLFAQHKGEGAFWEDFDWTSASREGMARVNLPYGGRTDFVETEMSWPVNHMVAPKESAVQCRDCHTRDNSRLAGLHDFYLPGRDYSPAVDTVGTLAVLFSLAGVGIHGVLRIALHKRRKVNPR